MTATALTTLWNRWFPEPASVPRCPFPVWLALGVGIVLRFAFIGAEPLRGDEGFTFLAATDPGGLTGRVAGDPHPFSFYAIYRLVAPLVVTSDGAFRIPSAIVSSLTLLLWPLTLRRLGLGSDAIRWCAVLFAALPLNVYYAQEARAYALVQLAGVACVALYAPFWGSVGRSRAVLLAGAVWLSSLLDVLGLIVPCSLLAHAALAGTAHRHARWLAASIAVGMALSSPYYAWRASQVSDVGGIHSSGGEAARPRVLADRMVDLSPLADLDNALPGPEKPKLALAALIVFACFAASRRIPDDWWRPGLASLFWLLVLVGPSVLILVKEMTNEGELATRYMTCSALGAVPLFVLGTLRLAGRLRFLPAVLLALAPVMLTLAQLTTPASPLDDWRTFYQSLGPQVEPSDGFVRRMTANWQGWALGRIHAYATQSGEPISPHDLYELPAISDASGAAWSPEAALAQREADRRASLEFADRRSRSRIWVITYTKETGEVDLGPTWVRCEGVEAGGLRAACWSRPSRPAATTSKRSEAPEHRDEPARAAGEERR